MADKVSKILDGIIWVCFLALAVITPLIFFSGNIEIFEVPKMHFVYLTSAIVLISTLIKSALQEKFLVPKSLPLFIFLIFLIVQILSTFFSIDKFTSIFGYPSRFNGGLLSQLAYLAILYTGLVNLNFEKAKKLLIAIVLSALFASLWGIPAHFGRDPSCLVLADKLTSDCWTEEFNPKLRIFSTLGQPNWLASYLVLTLPFAISLSLIFEKRVLRNFFAATSVILFVALVMTTSRAGILGLFFGLAVLAILAGRQLIKEKFKIIRIIMIGFLAAILLFGSFLFARISEILPRVQRPGSQDQNQTQQPNGPIAQSPNVGATESSEIRLIVWQGAIATFKARPILGFGPETFAYSYYLFRPASHNQTTEWNFFYNKAHNEFLNYLATVGALGTFFYCAFLLSVIYVLFILKEKEDSEKKLLTAAAIGSVLGYQTTIFFGFSTVAAQTTVFLAIAAILSFKNQNYFEIQIKDRLRLRFAQGLFFLGLIVLSFPIRLYFADLSWAKAKELESANTAKSLAAYQTAKSLSPFYNPFIESDFAYRQAVYANVLEDKSAVDLYTKEADKKAQKAEKSAKNNLIVKRRIANTYLLLAKVDKNFEEKAQDAGQDLIRLAPNDPQSYLTFAKILIGAGEKEKGLESLNYALFLKPDYLEAQGLLLQLTIDN